MTELMAATGVIILAWYVGLVATWAYFLNRARVRA